MAQRRMEHAIRMGWSFNRYQQSVIGTPLSYRRAEMLEDWHKLYPIALARTPEKRLRAIGFIEEYVEPMMERYEMSAGKVMRQIKIARAKVMALEPLSDIEFEFLKELDEVSPRIRRRATLRGWRG